MTRLPKNLEMQWDMEGLHIAYRWYSTRTVVLTIIAAIWTVSTLVSLAFSNTEHQPDHINFFAWAEAGMIAALLYYTAAHWLNRTHIVANRNRNTIRVHHEPLPWVGKKEIACSHVKQLYTAEKVWRNTKGHTTSFEIRVTLKDDRTVKLIGDLESREEGLYVETEIEKYLRIEDQPFWK